MNEKYKALSATEKGRILVVYPLNVCEGQGVSNKFSFLIIKKNKQTNHILIFKKLIPIQCGLFFSLNFCFHSISPVHWVALEKKKTDFFASHTLDQFFFWISFEVKGDIVCERNKTNKNNKDVKLIKTTFV